MGNSTPTKPPYRRARASRLSLIPAHLSEASRNVTP